MAEGKGAGDCEGLIGGRGRGRGRGARKEQDVVKRSVAGKRKWRDREERCGH